MQDLPLFVLWEQFLEWLFNHTDQFPKKARFTFSGRVENLALDILEEIVEATYSPKDKKKYHLRKVNLYLEKLRILLRICAKRKYLPYHSYEYAMQELEKAGNMVGGWIRSGEKNEESQGSF